MAFTLIKYNAFQCAFTEQFGARRWNAVRPDVVPALGDVTGSRHVWEKELSLEFYVPGLRNGQAPVTQD